MLPYVLTADAEQDLLEVARYTLDHWGSDMLKQYRDGLKEAFHAIATMARWMSVSPPVAVWAGSVDLECSIK